MTCPKRDAARSPGNANQGTGGRTQRHQPQSKTTTTVYDYTMPLPLAPALLTDAWVSEVVLTLRSRSALRRLVAALSAVEEVQP